MRIIRSLKFLSEFDRNVYLTLGSFDGLHIGHRSIINLMVSEANSAKATPVLFTFRKHPLSIIAPLKTPPIITPFKKKMILLKELGVEAVICLKFTREFAQINPEKFIKDIICKTLKAKKIFIGPTYFFGKNRQGSPELLKSKADRYGYSVNVLDTVNVDGIAASSTKVRQSVLSGEMGLARALLGRPYSVQGKVVRGTSKGKVLGIKTATLKIRSDLIPPDGVYFALADVSGIRHRALVNIGHQPTFGSYKRAIEVHIMGFDRDIYGEKMETFFLERIRAEKRFESVSELREQIEEDIRFVSSKS